MENKIVYEEKNGAVYSNLNFTTPKQFIHIYFDIETNKPNFFPEACSLHMIT